MCLICVELIKQRMTVTEAEKAVGEYFIGPTVLADKMEHFKKLKRALEELDLEELNKALTEGIDDQK